MKDGPAKQKTKRTNDPHGTRGRILDAAAELFQDKGYRATSTLDMARAAGVTGGALHHHFRTKKSIAMAVISERIAPSIRESWIDPVITADHAGDGIRVAFTRVIDGLEKQGFVRGCPLNNLAVELAYADDEFRTVLQPIFAGWTGAITTKLSSEGATQPSSAPSADELAVLVVAACSGAMAMAKTAQSTDPLAKVMTLLGTQFLAPAR